MNDTDTAQNEDDGSSGANVASDAARHSSSGTLTSVCRPR